METPLSFQSHACLLHGILHTPEDRLQRREAGIVFLNGWAGYRIGPHRIFVRAARRLAAAGFTALRFDFRGRGESEGAAGATSIATMIADVCAAVEALCAAEKLDRVILLGICSGGKVAVGAAPLDARVTRLVLWSADPLEAGSVASTQRRKGWHALQRYGEKLFRADTWRKLLRAQLNPRLIARALRGAEHPGTGGAEERAHDRALLERFRTFKGQVYFIYGGHDPETAPAIASFSVFCRAHRIVHQIDIIPDADHNFTSLTWEEEVIRKTLDWLA